MIAFTHKLFTILCFLSVNQRLCLFLQFVFLTTVLQYTHKPIFLLVCQNFFYASLRIDRHSPALVPVF